MTFQTDPFHTVHLLTEEERNRAKNQTIPKLSDLLELAKKTSTRIIFDLYSIYNHSDCDDSDDTVDTVETILASNIDQQLVGLNVLVEFNERKYLIWQDFKKFSCFRSTGYRQKIEHM